MLIKNDFEIINYTSFKIGGKAVIIYYPECDDDFKDLPDNFYVIGNLSNTLVSSFGINLPLVSLSKIDSIKIDGLNVTAGAGVRGPKLSQTVAEAGLSGLEFMIGFPGSVGGEVFMNAGANNQTIADVFSCAKVFSPANGLITVDKSDMNFGYRNSVCKEKNWIVIESSFNLQKEKPEIIKQKMADNLEFRKKHQPSLSLPNCGSVFKNPENNSAGRLLDECGVKGLHVGGAKVWENHANFIVNDGTAKSFDVLELMCEMKVRVKEKFDIDLIPEICYLGGNNEEEELLCKQLYQK